MSRTIYQEKRGLLKDKTSLDDFISAVMPILRVYIAAGEWGETRRSDDSNWEMTLGDEQNAYLKHTVSIPPYTDIYSGYEGYESFRSYQLIHPTTNEKLDVYICISRMVFTFDEIEIEFEGEVGEVENLKKAVQPVLENYRIEIHFENR